MDLASAFYCQFKIIDIYRCITFVKLNLLRYFYCISFTCPVCFGGCLTFPFASFYVFICVINYLNHLALKGGEQRKFYLDTAFGDDFILKISSYHFFLMLISYCIWTIYSISLFYPALVCTVHVGYIVHYGSILSFPVLVGHYGNTRVASEYLLVLFLMKYLFYTLLTLFIYFFQVLFL